MGRRKRKFSDLPPEDELLAILRAADDIIGEGGRTLLSKILKGSKEKKLLEIGLNRNPSYGALKTYTTEQIVEKIDQLINGGYLYTSMSGKMPVIEFTSYGWLIERDRRAEEFLLEWDIGIENNIMPQDMEYLKDRNRGLILLFLYKILCRADKKYIPYLQIWVAGAYKKVRAEINKVIDALNKREKLDETSWEHLKLKRAETLLLREEDPVFRVCEKCDGMMIIDETDPELYESGRLKVPTTCIRCSYGGEGTY